jgi:membrane-associated phospholipid phosphatase
VDGKRLFAAVRRRANRGALAGFLLLVAVYVLAVWTRAGQRFEDAVLEAAGQADAVRATTTLNRISATTVLAALAVLLAIGLVRRRPLLGVLAGGVVATSVITAEVIQRSVPRPILLESGYRREDQSFPSGHAAVATSVMCALVLVVPYRWRGPVLLLAFTGAASVEVSTVTAGWHRPSDTIGSDLIVVFFTCAVVAVLARLGWVSGATLRTKTGRTAQAALAGGYAALALAAFLVAAVTGADASGRAGDPTSIVDDTVLTAGRALALSGSSGVALSLLALLRRVDLVGPGSAAGRGGRDGER